MGHEKFEIRIVTGDVTGKTWTKQCEKSRIIVGNFSVVIAVKEQGGGCV